MKKAFLLLALAAWALAACQTPTPAPTPTPSLPSPPEQTPTSLPVLEIYHWWTAGSDRQAMDLLFAGFEARLPGVQMIENPPGAAGESPFQALQAALAAAQPPDAFQLTGGAELYTYLDQGSLQPLEDFYQQSAYQDVLASPVYNAVAPGGHPRAVPLTLHVQNLLYYDQQLFAELDLQPPTGYSGLLVALETIRAARPGMAPLALAGKEEWAAELLLDSLLLEEGGLAYFVSFYKGEIDPRHDPHFRRALEKLAQLLPYATPFSAGVTWEGAAASLSEGDSAVLLMGSWALKRFEALGALPGEQLSILVFPQEPEPALLFHADAFALPPGAPHANAANAWLETLADPELQASAVAVQGGFFARTDIEPGQMPDPFRQELQAFIDQNPLKLAPGQFGSPAPYPFTQAYWQAIDQFADRPDIEAAILQVTDLFLSYQVKENAAWYQWP